ncbi:hypothetical protein [Siphonobacter sp. SORGH_AS_0500]|uniref:hypothetical protein n=1 Tax=Siphonobacter sp. SORGH_AS_0500 TaxID=1864824 RepID=UPI0012FEE784|nr:hypothetical protein [Siphonobacter sp. SORGH_AS_0500]
MTLSRLVAYSQSLGSYAVVGVSPAICMQTVVGETPAMAGDLIQMYFNTNRPEAYQYFVTRQSRATAG